jgi:hypothetical protein
MPDRSFLEHGRFQDLPDARFVSPMSVVIPGNDCEQHP